MKSDRLVIAAVIFLAGGMALLFGFTNGTTGLSLGYPFSETRLHVDLTTTGVPALVGIPLVAAGTLLLFFALVAAVASQFQRPPEPPIALNLPTRRREPFAEFNEAHPQRPGEFE